MKRISIEFNLYFIMKFSIEHKISINTDVFWSYDFSCDGYSFMRIIYLKKKERKNASCIIHVVRKVLTISYQALKRFIMNTWTMNDEIHMQFLLFFCIHTRVFGVSFLLFFSFHFISIFSSILSVYPFSIFSFLFFFFSRVCVYGYYNHSVLSLLLFRTNSPLMQTIKIFVHKIF